MSRPRFFLSLCLILSSACPAFCKPCSVIHIQTATPAEKAMRNDKFEEAENLYAAVLEKTPADEAALSGLILSQLYQDHVDAALASAQNAVKRLPSSALLTTNLGEVQFRKGHTSEANELYVHAKALDLCNPRLYLAESRFSQVRSMHATARSLINLAHQLSPDDPEITSAWMSLQTGATRTAALKKHLEDKDLADDEKASMTTRLQESESIDKARAERGKCKVVSTAKSMKTPFKWIMRDANTIEALALDVRLNDKATARLQIDTGASGILIRRGIASKAGLVPLFHSKIYGIGDEGPQTSYLAMADDLKIGQFEFQNCLVEVSDKRRVADEDGLIGGDVFRDYLLTIDFPDKSLQVDPLPAPSGENQVATITGTEDQEEATPRDAYIAPEMKDWTRVLRFGHDLLVPVGLGDSKVHWFILDTGAFATSLSPEAASVITKVSRDRDLEVKGLNGKVQDVLKAKKVDVTFGGVRQELRDAVVLKMDKANNAMGFDCSGFLGFGTLQYLAIQIDYRDGLVHFKYDPNHGTNRFFQ